MYECILLRIYAQTREEINYIHTYTHIHTSMTYIRRSHISTCRVHTHTYITFKPLTYTHTPTHVHTYHFHRHDAVNTRTYTYAYLYRCIRCHRPRVVLQHTTFVLTAFDIQSCTYLHGHMMVLAKLSASTHTHTYTHTHTHARRLISKVARTYTGI